METHPSSETHARCLRTAPEIKRIVERLVLTILLVPPFQPGGVAALILSSLIGLNEYTAGESGGWRVAAHINVEGGEKAESGGWRVAAHINVQGGERAESKGQANAEEEGKKRAERYVAGHPSCDRRGRTSLDKLIRR